MLTRDVAFEGFTYREWVLLREAFRPTPGLPRERSERQQADAVEAVRAHPAGGVVAVTSGSQLRKLVSTRIGRLDVREQPWPEALESLAARHAARWAAELTAGALDDLMDRFGDRLNPGQDYLSQALDALGILRELEAEGALSVWPGRIAEWPVPSERALLRGLDMLCPDGRALVLGVFDAGDLATCLVLRRRGSGFDKLVGPAELRPHMGLLSGDFHRDQRFLSAAVERQVAPVAAGCFGELATFRALSGSRAPGAWARAVAAHQIVIAPWSPGVALPLGLDVGRALFREIGAFASWLGAGHLLSRDGPLAHAVLGLERPSWLDHDLTEFLGFDPWKLVSRLLSRGPEA